MISRKKKIIALAIIFFSVFILVGAGCAKPKPIKPDPVSLQWWGVWNESDQVAPLIAAYQASHQYVKISYKKFRLEEFETKLTESLAEDRGPDIISINNTWVKRYQSKIFRSHWKSAKKRSRRGDCLFAVDRSRVKFQNLER